MFSPRVEPFDPAVRCGMFLPDLSRGEDLGNFGGVNPGNVIGPALFACSTTPASAFVWAVLVATTV